MNQVTNPLQQFSSSQTTVNDTVSTEDIGSTIIGGALRLFGKIKDSTGFFEYRKAMKLFQELQKAKVLNYGGDNAIPVTKVKMVADYLKEHANDEFKSIFKAVDKLLSENDIPMVGENNIEWIANFIAKDLAKLPETTTFTFQHKGELIDTTIPENFDNLMMLFRHTIESGKYSLMNIILAGNWVDFNERIQATYKNMYDTLVKVRAKDTITWNYSSKRISTLYMIENQLSNSSYFEKGGNKIKAWLTENLIPSFGNKSKQAKDDVAEVFRKISDIINELIKSNDIIAGKALGNINEYYEELIKLSKSKHFKAR